MSQARLSRSVKRAKKMARKRRLTEEPISPSTSALSAIQLPYGFIAVVVRNQMLTTEIAALFEDIGNRYLDISDALSAHLPGRT